MESTLQAQPSQQAQGGINASVLKIIAITGMTLDHIGIAFSSHLPLWAQIALFAFGGLTFPIMAFLMVEGYQRTSNFKRYALRLLTFALISLIPFMWGLRMRSLNVMFTLLLGLLTLYLYDHMKARAAFWLVFVGFTLATLFMDWSLMGVPMVLLYRTLQGKWKRLILPILLPISMMIVSTVAALVFMPEQVSGTFPSLAYALVGCTLTVPLLVNYNGQRGLPLKYLFYAYYPGHLIVLALVRGLLFQDWKF